MKSFSRKEKKAEAPKPPEETPAASTTVKMHRSEEDAKGGPTTAEVHPSEVENWKAAGWEAK